jgi:hypothetical protein
VVSEQATVSVRAIVRTHPDYHLDIRIAADAAFVLQRISDNYAPPHRMRPKRASEGEKTPFLRIGVKAPILSQGEITPPYALADLRPEAW